METFLRENSAAVPTIRFTLVGSFVGICIACQQQDWNGNICLDDVRSTKE